MKKIKFESDLPQVLECGYFYNSDRKYIFPCLSELLDFLEQFDTDNCYFRGQAGLWNISSSLFRHYGKPEFEKAKIMSVIARNMLLDNKYIGNAVQNNDNYALAIAQHYGCPTDLVDVTTSLRVAAYFAASENYFHSKDSEGCIWIFSERNIKQIQKSAQGLLNTLDLGYISSALELCNGNLLVQPNIPMLSRLNAQKGAFLWDVGGSLNTLIRVSGSGVCFVFKHTPDEMSEFEKDKKWLFPLPNQLESEIMRIFTEKSRVNGLPEYIGPISKLIDEHTGVLKNGLLKEMVDRFRNSIVLKKPDLFTPSFGEYDWEYRTIVQTKIKPKNINMDIFEECYIHFDLDGIMTFVNHVLDAYDNESMTDYLIFLKDDEHKRLYTISDTMYMLEIVICLNNYFYTPEEISQILIEYLRMTVFKYENQFAPKSEEEFALALVTHQVEDLVEKYYGCPVTKLSLEDTMGEIYFWLPSNYVFLDANYLSEFRDFDKTYLPMPKFINDWNIDIPDNAKIFLYQHKPQKIISYKGMREMFIRLILPQLFAFRPTSERLYIPDHIKSIVHSFFGRPLYFND